MAVVLEAYGWGGGSGIRPGCRPGRSLGEENWGARARGLLLVRFDGFVVPKGFDDMQGFTDGVQTFLVCGPVKCLGDGL